MMNPKNTNESPLHRDEQRDLQAAIQQAVLGAEGLGEELEHSAGAYLCLVARSDLAVGESTS